MNEYQELKRKVDRARQERDRAEGALRQIQSDMSGRFGVKTKKEADSRLKKMRIELENLQSGFDSELKEFMAKWKDKLDV